MQFIKRLLESDVAIAKQLSDDEIVFQEQLKKFLDSYETKQRVLESLLEGETVHAHIYKLQYVLAEELTSVEESDRMEKEILCDLKILAKERYIKHLDALADLLQQAETRDEYVRSILDELQDVLLAEAQKVHRLLHGDTHDGLEQEVVDLLTMEKELVEKLAMVHDFRELFRNLASGVARRAKAELVWKRVNTRIKELVKEVELGPEGKAVSTNGHYLSDLSARCFNYIEQWIMVAVQRGEIERHPEIDLQFVNSPMFDRFVIEQIQLDHNFGKLTPSQRTTQEFINAFRQVYNAA